MPRWLPRAMIMALVLVGLYQLSAWAFDQLLGLLVILLVSFFLATAIEPAVTFLARRGLRRGAGTCLVFVVLFIAIALFVTALGSLLVDQVSSIVQNFPAYIDDLLSWVNRTFHVNITLDRVQRGLLADSGTAKKWAQEAANNAWGLSSSVLGGLFDMLTVTLFTFYLAAEGPRLRRWICSALPPAKQVYVLTAWDTALAKTAGYLYSRAILAAISAVCHYILLLVLGVPYAPFLAIWVGLVSQFVPTIGTYLAIVLPALIGFAYRPIDALWIVLFATVYQQVENYLLQPRITARTVDIHPAVAFGSVIAGAALLGAVGALIAIPAAATIQGVLGAYVKRYPMTDAQELGLRLAMDQPGKRRRRRRRDGDGSGGDGSGGDGSGGDAAED
ncbi:AI-2E family transporter [Mangrovactinospora gilvigrisea]|uniref:AI-2E family transporter n=1 Tax=Mangrovactinospora gilvigrisea TaxID=1428644 RepID=A0A1J7C4X0_9ACTN|nr:AI-2E family transporter [Mangrovactinospora gilvigrisea]